MRHLNKIAEGKKCKWMRSVGRQHVQKWRKTKHTYELPIEKKEYSVSGVAELSGNFLYAETEKKMVKHLYFRIEEKSTGKAFL